MKNKRKSGNPSSSRARELRTELARRIAFFIGCSEKLVTDIPGLLLSRRTAPTAPTSATYEPSLAVVAQGRKRAVLAGTTFIFDESRYLLTSICQSYTGSGFRRGAYLCLVLRLDTRSPQTRRGGWAKAPPDSPPWQPVNHGPSSRCLLPPHLLNTASIPFLVADSREIIYDPAGT